MNNFNYVDPLFFPLNPDITCTAPDIPNGEVVDLMAVYQKDATLKYRCFKGFKIRDAFPRCASHGWTLNPECDGNSPLL